jgi:hypothetical protein
VVFQRVDWTVADTYVDQASASDLRGRVAWRRLLDHAVKCYRPVYPYFHARRCTRRGLAKRAL